MACVWKEDGSSKTVRPLLLVGNVKLAMALTQLEVAAGLGVEANLFAYFKRIYPFPACVG